MLQLKKLRLEELESIGVGVFNLKSYADDRGSLEIVFETERKLCENGLSIKRSFSQPGVGRGLHLQGIEAPQSKLVTVKDGKLFDFLYDPTTNSEQVYCFELDSKQGASIYIPPRFAHGFVSASFVVFEYICFGSYNESYETTYNLLPSAAEQLGLGSVKLSKKDLSAPLIKVML